MRYDSPSATLEKKDDQGNKLPNIVKVTNRALDEEAKDGTKIEIPANQFMYPQTENDDNMATLCGGKDNILKVFNATIANDALKAAKDKIRLAGSGTIEEIIAAGVAAGKNFTYVEETSISAAEAKNRISELRAIAQSGDKTDAELAAEFKKLLGIS